jgi:hypothetical protein
LGSRGRAAEHAVDLALAYLVRGDVGGVLGPAQLVAARPPILNTTFIVIGRSRDAPQAPAATILAGPAVVPMSARGVRRGVLASGLLAGLYAAVVVGASGLDHLAGQARADWYLLVPILAGFGVQVALMTELRHRRRQAHLADQRVVFMVAGLGVNVVAVVLATRWLRQLSRSSGKEPVCAPVSSSP